MVLMFYTLSYGALYLLEILSTISLTIFNLQSGHEYMVEMTMFNVKRAITPKVSNQSYSSCVLHIVLMVFYICVKFRENITNGIELWSKHDYMVEMAMFNVQRVITPSVGKPELQFVCSAHHLIVIDIGVKFRENISKGFRVMERTRNYVVLTDGGTLKIWTV